MLFHGMTSTRDYHLLGCRHLGPVKSELSPHVPLPHICASRKYSHFLICTYTGIILCMHPANGRRRYNVASSLIGWAHTPNDHCIYVSQVRLFHISSQGKTRKIMLGQVVLIGSAGYTSLKCRWSGAKFTPKMFPKFTLLFAPEVFCVSWYYDLCSTLVTAAMYLISHSITHVDLYYPCTLISKYDNNPLQEYNRHKHFCPWWYYVMVLFFSFLEKCSSLRCCWWLWCNTRLVNNPGNSVTAYWRGKDEVVIPCFL